jgi:uncharacterized protein
VIVLDTSAILASMNVDDPDHARVVAAMAGEQHLIIPAGIMAEVTLLIDSRFGAASLQGFMQSLVDGEVAIDWQHGDLRRAAELMIKYHDLALGYADAAVIVCAERNGGRVATLDRRHFGVVAGEGTIQIVP